MNTHFKTQISIMISMLIMLISCTGSAQDGKTPTITKTFEMDQPGTLITSSSGGGIHVYSHDENKVLVHVFIRKSGKLLPPSSSQIDEVLEAYELVTEKNGTIITATAKRKEFRKLWNNTGIYFTIIVPREMSCNVSSSGGGVKVAGVKGTHDLSSSGGGVKLENLAGITKAKSSGGSVKAANMNGDVHLTSSGGSVTLEKAKGHVFAHSSGGGVFLYDIHGGDVDAKSSGGSVKITGKAGAVEAKSSGGGVKIQGEAGYVEAKSSGGSVYVNISNLNKEMYLQSSGGGIEAVIQNGKNLGLDLDLSSGKVNIDLKNFSGKAEKGYVKGTMNNGGIPVYMRASGGNVTVRFEE